MNTNYNMLSDLVGGDCGNTNEGQLILPRPRW